LIAVVRQLVEETEKSAVKASQFSRSLVNVDDRSSVRWKLGEDELSAILYLLDICCDLVPAAKLLLWLLPKVLSNPNSTIHSGRNSMMLPRNVENHACEVGEAFLLSSLRRLDMQKLCGYKVPVCIMLFLISMKCFLLINVLLAY
jgi:hypothetical protein